MGFKYQILCCASPDQLFQVTMNHLESVKEIVSSEEVSPLIQEAIIQVMEVG